MNRPRPHRTEYSEHGLASMNGYAMIAIVVVLVVVALMRFTSIGDEMAVSTVLLSHVLLGALTASLYAGSIKNVIADR